MKKPTIISKIRINGEWMRQEDIPPDVVHRIVAETLIRAGAHVGFEVTRKEKTA